MSTPSIRWVRLASTLEELSLSPEGLTELEAGGKHLCVAHQNGSLFACVAKCPHAGGHLAEGYIDPLGNIVCPLHRYKFSLATGRNTSGEGYYLRTYPVEVRPDGIYVGFEEKKWGW